MTASLFLYPEIVLFRSNYGQIYGQVCHSKLLVYNDFNGLSDFLNESAWRHLDSRAKFKLTRAAALAEWRLVCASKVSLIKLSCDCTEFL